MVYYSFHSLFILKAGGEVKNFFDFCYNNLSKYFSQVCLRLSCIDDIPGHIFCLRMESIC